ncbi:MAG: hypothetical protein JRF53_05500 [Deltaproteobacteria bacterium]|nr:hypothetical protein [Deltaproteobacteria bacterium]
MNLTGGAGNLAEASIGSDNDVLVTVTGGNVNVQGGSGNDAWAGISADGSLVLNVTTGSLSVTGGSAFEASAGVTTDGGGTIDVSVGGNLTLTGGSGLDASAGIASEGIGTPIINIDVAGDFQMSGGAGQGPAVIGSAEQSVMINIGPTNPVGGSISISGGTGANAIALIGTVGAGHNADVTINGGGSVNLFGGGGGALIGTSTDHGDITIKTGMLGSGDLILDYSEILTADDIVLDVAGLLSLNGGSTINQASRIASNTGTLTVDADALEQFAGSGDSAEARLEAATGITLDISGNALAQAGSGDDADAEIVSRAGTLDMDIGGSFTILGGAGLDANAGPNAEGGGTLLLDVAGNLIITGGSGSSASAGIGGSGGSGTFDLNVGGNLFITGGSGTNAVAGIGSSTEDVIITIGAANPVGGDIYLKGGTGANAAAVIGADGAHNANVTIETNGSLTLNAQTGGTLIGSELAGGLVDINAGLGGTGGIALNDGTIRVDDDVTLQATAPGGTITQNAAGIINIGTKTLTANADGDIILLGTNTVGDFVPSSANGNVDYLHQGAFSIDTPIAGVSGDMTFRATCGISQTAPVTNVNILNLIAGGAINMNNAGNSVTVLNATDSSGTGISFQNNGDLNIGLLDAGAGPVTVTVIGAGSSLSDANAGAVNVVGAAGVILEAPVNIGTLADPLEIQTASLTLQGTHTGEVAIANTGNLAFAGGAGMSDLLLTTTGTLDLTGLIGGGSENLDVRANGFDLSGFPIDGANVKLSGGSGTLDINSTNVQGSYVELEGSQIRIRQGFAPPAQVNSTGNIFIHGGTLTVDSASVHSIADTTLQTSSVTLQATGTNNALVQADADMTVNTGSLQVLGSTTSASLNSKLEADGTMKITAGSVTVQGGNLSNTFASIDPTGLVMNVSGDVNVLGGDGMGSYAEISADTVEITAGPTASAGNINITGGSGMDAGAWIQSTGGDITLIAGDTMFPSDIHLIGGSGVNADSLIDAGGGSYDVYLTFHNGVGLTLLPVLTGATDVGILAMNLILNSYDPFYQPPMDPINDVVSSQDQLDELLDEIMGAPDDPLITGDGTGDEEEEEEKKRGRLICR